MRIFYQTGELFDEGKFLGYKGTDLKTGETELFSHYNSQNEFNENILYYYSQENSENSQGDFEHYKKTKKDIIMEKILEYSSSSIIKNIQCHYDYNERCDLPTNYLSFNSQNLNIKIENKDEDSYGYYMPIGNILSLKLGEISKLFFNKHIKKEIDDTCCHEVGHIKASKITIDQNSNILIARVGFYYIAYKLEPLKINNGDLFFKVLRPIQRNDLYLGEILEEIINETECLELDPNYKRNFPDYGKIINEICDNRLNMARYNGGIDIYYECMTNLIPDENRAKEVLELIDEGIKDDSVFYKKRRDALKLIKEYKDVIKRGR